MRHRSATLLLPSVILMSTLTLGGCSWFNDMGEHFPVVGERCEYWQCFTEYGRQQSDAIRQSKERAGEGDTPPGTTAPGTAPAGSVPASQGAPPSHVEFIDPDKVESTDTVSP